MKNMYSNVNSGALLAIIRTKQMTNDDTQTQQEWGKEITSANKKQVWYPI